MKDYIVYGLTTEELKVVCKQALNGELNKNVRIVFNMFGEVSHLIVSLTNKEARKIRRQMLIDNLRNKDAHYELILKEAAL